jgi:hypothetical protein
VSHPEFPDGHYSIKQLSVCRHGRELLQRKVKKLHERSKPDNSILLQLAVQGVPADAEPARCNLTYDDDNVNIPIPFDYEVKKV